MPGCSFIARKLFLMLRINFIKYLPFLVGRFFGMKQKILFRDIPRDQRSVQKQVNKLLKDYKNKKNKDEQASGIKPDPATENETLLE